MMINPKDFGDICLAGKDALSIQNIIKDIQKRIGELKEQIEYSEWGDNPYISPRPSVAIKIYRQYLIKAKKVLLSLGGKYKPTANEIQDKEFNSNLKNIKRIYFKNRANIPIEILFENDNIIVVYERDKKATEKIKKLLGIDLEKTKLDISKIKFIELLENLHIGEWQERYYPKNIKFPIHNEAEWELVFEFENSILKKRFYGNMAYPFNYEEVENFINNVAFKFYLCEVYYL